MDPAVLIFLFLMVVPAVFVTLYIRRVIRIRQESARERQRHLEAQLRKQHALERNPKSVSRRTL